MTAVEVNIGSPATLNIVEGRRGSRWLLTLTFSVDLTTVTAVTAVLRRRGDTDTDTARLTFTADLTNKATGVIVLTATKEQTAALTAGDYLWEMQFTASSTLYDRWAPLRGVWPVTDRVAV